MKEGKAESNNKGLIILLCALVVVIVGLGIGIGVVMLNRKGEEVVVVEDDQMTESEISYYAYLDNYDEVQKRVEELLNQDPVDVAMVVDLYYEYINDCLGNNELDRASSYINAEYNNLVNAGFKGETLDVLTSIDFSIFDLPEQYRQYSKIVELAKDLDREDIVEIYEPLVANSKEAFESSCKVSESLAAEFGLEYDKNACNSGGTE